MPTNNAAHTALVAKALEELALAGYCAWPTNTGALKTSTGGFVKFGKKGGGDITLILPPLGRHVECEAKTGGGVQNTNQKRHQEFVIERNGGIYILFRSIDELMEKIREIK